MSQHHQPSAGSESQPGDVAGERALVLSGGGSTGNAWMIGVLAGLLDAGVDVTNADLTIGTSAGATTAAQLGGASQRVGATLSELFAATQTPLPGHRPRPGGSGAPGDGGDRVGQAAAQMERTGQIIAAAHDAADMRRRMGAAALKLAAASDGSWRERWRGIVASRLPSHDWPDRKLLITAVDAHTGEPATFDRESGVDLVDAVAASCSSGLPYRIGDNDYIDGGYRRNENADLAAGYRRVLVLTPFGGRTRHPLAWGMQLAAQVEELRAAGTRVETIVPDSESISILGADAMDLTLRAPAARAGYERGTALAAQVGVCWS